MRFSATDIKVIRAKLANGTSPDHADVKRAFDALGEMLDEPASVSAGAAFQLYKWRLKWFR